MDHDRDRWLIAVLDRTWPPRDVPAVQMPDALRTLTAVGTIAGAWVALSLIMFDPQPGTLRVAVFLCGAVLGVMGRDVWNQVGGFDPAAGTEVRSGPIVDIHTKDEVGLLSRRQWPAIHVVAVRAQRDVERRGECVVEVGRDVHVWRAGV